MSKSTVACDPHRVVRISRKEIEIVLGGGGVKGFSLVGFLKAILELRVKVGKVTGVSIGSLVAAFYTNGYSPEEIVEIFLEEIIRFSPARIVKSMLTPAWLGAFTGGDVGFGVSIRSIVEDIVAKYDLKPNENLRIIAFNLLGREPVVFEGPDMDLVTALSASCAVPLVMRPVWFGQSGLLSRASALAGSALKATDQGLLIDGGLHHPAPGNFCKGPAIIAKLGFASELPSRFMGPVDLWFHMLELSCSRLLDWVFPDPKGHIVVPVGSKNIACLSFGTPERECLRMVEEGYAATMRHLSAAIEDGRVPVRKVAVRRKATSD